MKKEILINAGRLESRVAILEDGQLAELHIEREPKVAGNIYKGRITNVVPGMDAAFAEIGLERNAFLCVDDIIMRREEQEVLGVPAPSEKKHQPITKLVRPHQEVLMQVVRAPLGSKGARVTTRLALPGRYLVLMLHTDGAYVGVSRKITDEKERARLRKIGEKLRPEHHSIILRTESEGKGIPDIRKDLEFLSQLAERIMEKSKHVSSPALLHQDLTIIYKVIRDSFSREVERVLVDNAEAYDNIRDLVAMISPSLKKRVQRYEDKMPLFAAFDLEQEIDRLLRRRVRLPSGGHLTVDTTEALVTIDVNSGRYTGGAGIEETVTHTNLEASREIARQLRLRDLGGIIVLDFIDMERAKHRQQVTEAFSEALKRDRAKIKIHEISPLGLIEMTRKRTGENLMEQLTDPCPYCSGTGIVRTPLTMALRIERELVKTSVTSAADSYLVRAHPKVAALLIGPAGEHITGLQEEVGKPVYVRAVEGHVEEYTIEPMTAAEAAARVHLPAVGAELEVLVVDQDPMLGLEAVGLAEGGYHVRLDAPAADLSQARVLVRLTGVAPSLAEGEIVAEISRPQPQAAPAPAKKRRRRARRRSAEPLEELLPIEEEGQEEVAAAEIAEPEPAKKRRRRRRRSHAAPEAEPSEQAAAELPTEPAAPAQPELPVPAAAGEAELTPAKKRRRRSRRRSTTETESAAEATAEPAAQAPPEPPAAEMMEEAAPPKKRRRRGRRRRHSGEEAGDGSSLDLGVTQALAAAPDLPAQVQGQALSPALEPAAEAVAAETAAERPSRRRRRRRKTHAADEPVAGQPEPQPPLPSPEEQLAASRADRPARRRRPRRRRSGNGAGDTGPALDEEVQPYVPGQPGARDIPPWRVSAVQQSLQPDLPTGAAGAGETPSGGTETEAPPKRRRRPRRRRSTGGGEPPTESPA